MIEFSLILFWFPRGDLRLQAHFFAEYFNKDHDKDFEQQALEEHFESYS